MITAFNYFCILLFYYTYYSTLFSQLCRNKIIFEIPPQRSKRIWLQKFKLFFASVDLLITSSPIIIMILLSKCQIKFLTTSSMQLDVACCCFGSFSKENKIETFNFYAINGKVNRYSARNLEMSIRFSLKSRPSERFHRPEMSQIKTEISLRTNVKLICHKNVGLQ